MDIVCALYIGHQDYLGDDPQLPESESKQLFAEEIAAVVDKNLSGDPSDIQPTKDTAELDSAIHAKLIVGGREIEFHGVPEINFE